MKKRHTAALPFMAWLCFTLAACHKDNNNPPVTTVPPADTIANGKLRIDLSINGPQANWNFTKQYELIFSEPAGKVLLDTIMQPGMRLNTTLATNATLNTTLVSGLLTLTWPVASSGFTLASSPKLGNDAVWTPVLVTPSVDSGNYQVSVSSDTGTMFYRLQR